MGDAANLHFGQALLPSGWARDVRIGFRAGICERMETGVAPSPCDEQHAIALPGLPNLHSHAFQRGMAGLAERRGAASDSFWTWREVMYRFADRIGPDDLRAIAALAYVEMLETGFTRVGEFHYVHHERDGRGFADPGRMAEGIAAAVADSGIGITLLPVYYAHAGFGGQAPGDGQKRFVCDLDRYAVLVDASRRALAGSPDAVVGIAPHSLRAVTPADLSALLGLFPTGPVHMHVAEQVQEVEDCVAWSGARPVEWLLDNVPIDRRWCLVHATHMLDAEAARLARTGAVAGLCPITEANLGDGLFNLSPFLAAGGRLGIGSDSNVLIDASEELRLLEYGQRLFRRARNVVPAGEGDSTGAALFARSVAGGAQALGVGGGLAVGRPLDLVSLRGAHPALIGKSADDLLDAWIFASGRTAIDCVWRHGEKLVDRGRHRRRDAIEARFATVVRRLL